MTGITYRTADVDGFNIFHREAGAPGAPKLLLLHGSPSAGHMFLDTGHFALETHAAEIADAMRDFLAR
jgi:pimeloyl-ACP methyl ester carboxylesterase